MEEAFQISSLEDEGRQDGDFKAEDTKEEDFKEEEDSREEEEGETGVAEEADGRSRFLTQNLALSTKAQYCMSFCYYE